MTDGRWQTVLDVAAAARRRYHVPGLAIGIPTDGQARSGGLGVTDPRAPVDIAGGTLFQIGSIAKMVTAVLALLLHQRGSLDLDALARRYLPYFAVTEARQVGRPPVTHER
jgi:CubicO group peptidase (beta-lactamase class C family)